MLTGAHQYHRDGDVLSRKLGRAEPDEGREVLEAVLLTSVVEGAGVAPEMRRDLRLGEPQHALDRRQRQRVVLLARAHHQRMADRERQRQANREYRALARL